MIPFPYFQKMYTSDTLGHVAKASDVLPQTTLVSLVFTQPEPTSEDKINIQM